jgi:site-specific DNA recombinase
MLELVSDQFSPLQVENVHRKAKTLYKDLISPSPHRKIALFKALIHRITISQHLLKISIRLQGLRVLLGIVPTADENIGADRDTVDLKEWVIPVSLRRYGKEIKLVLGDRTATAPRAHSETIKSLQRALKKALVWNDALLTGKVASLADIARQEKVAQRYIATMIRLAFLAPDIQEAILDGFVPAGWTVDRFRKGIPLDWSQQRHRFPSKTET